MRVAVIGLGYVGLPVAVESVKSGHKVTGVDLNSQVISSLKQGISHVDDISNEDINQILNLGFQPTTDFSLVRESDVVIICVPTPLSEVGGPDLSYLESAGKFIGKNFSSGTLVSLESTSYPGTTEEVLRPILDKFSGLNAGKDYFLVFSPERIDPGNKKFNFRNTPKIVGGLDKNSLAQGVAFYSTIVDQISVAIGLKEAEMAKLLENTYRHINIALVNEMAKFCHELDVDIWDVIKNAATKPFGFESFYPGPGVGGHCIPIDPNYLSHKVQTELGYPFKFVQLAEEINSSMPNYVVTRVKKILNKSVSNLDKAKILLIGISYKKGIADTRETPAYPIANSLLELGAEVEYWDPLIPNWKVNDKFLKSVKDPVKTGKKSDLIVILQDLDQLTQFNWAPLSSKIFQTRGNSQIRGKFIL